jgi:nucleoporin GLE1
MAGSSPSRRQSNHWANRSPQRSVLEEILGDDRNSEARHRQLLEAAKKEHDRVREEAERVYREQLLREERERLLAERRREEERIALEEKLAAERVRLNALKAKKVEIPPPLPEPEPPVAPAVNGKPPAASSIGNNVPAQPNGTTLQQATAPAVPLPKPTAAPVAAQTASHAPAATPNKAPEPAKPPSSILGVSGILNTAPQPNGVPSSAGTSRTAAPAPAPAGPDRYLEIHKNLKILRKSMVAQAKTNPLLKSRMGDMRRELRKAVGQLTPTQGVAGVNKIQVWLSPF